MWPWRRKDAASPATPPVRRGDWRTLPPIQPIVLDHPLVNPVQRFADSLTSWQNPSYLAPLAHQVGPAEPSGVIADYARPAPVDLPVAQPPRRRPSAVGGVWSRLRDVVAQRSAAPASASPEVLPRVEPEPAVFDEPAAPEATGYEEPGYEESAPVVHEVLVTPEPALRGEPVAAPEPLVREDPVAPELVVRQDPVALEPLVREDSATPEPVADVPPAEPGPAPPEEPVGTLGAGTAVEVASPIEPVRPSAALDPVAPAVPSRVEVAGGGPSTPQVQRMVAPEAVAGTPVAVQRELVAKAPDRSPSPAPAVRPVVSRTDSPAPPPEPLVQRQVADVVAQEPPTVAPAAEPELMPDEPDFVATPAPLLSEVTHERHEPSPVPSATQIPLAQRAIHPVARKVEQAPMAGSSPVVPPVQRISEPGPSATVPSVRETPSVPETPLVRKEVRPASRDTDESAAPAVQRIVDSPTPLVRQVVAISVPPPVRHEVQRAAIEASVTREDVRPVMPPPAPSMVQRQISSVAEAGGPEIAVARRRGLGAPILPDSEPPQRLPELPRAALPEPPATVQRAPEVVSRPEATRPEAAPSGTVRLAHLEPLTDHGPTDHRPAVQRLQEAPSPPPVERIELVGERPLSVNRLSVNRVESGPDDLVRPWAAAAPAAVPAQTPNGTWGEPRSTARGAPVVVPPIVSRLIEGAPLAVTTSPVVEAPVQRVEQVVRTSAAVQREEAQDVAPAAVSPAAAVPVAAGGEPEELVKKLYDPLLRRLKAELWLDRERRGALTDLWH